MRKCKLSQLRAADSRLIVYLRNSYGNQKECALGMKRAFDEVDGLKREDVFITSKLWNTQHRPQDVEAALDENAASGISRLGLAELGFLFGVNDLPAGRGR